MADLLCANVVSDAYFENPAALPDHLHARGDRLGVRMLWLAGPGDVTLLPKAPSGPFLETVCHILGYTPNMLIVRRMGRRTLPQAALADQTVLAALRNSGIRAIWPYAASRDVYQLRAC